MHCTRAVSLRQDAAVLSAGCTTMVASPMSAGKNNKALMVLLTDCCAYDTR